MKIEVRFRGLESSEAVRAQVERRAHFQLSRFSSEVKSLVVRVSDVNGPKGGVDKRCHVTARGPSLAAVTIEEMSGDVHSAIDVALERVARAVTRELQRTRMSRRAVGGLRQAY